MLTLLNLLSAVALLVWGTHIVRTGIMRVYGADLRRVISRSVEKSLWLFLPASVSLLWYKAVTPPRYWSPLSCRKI